MAGNRMMSLKAALAVCLAIAGSTLFSLQGATAQSSSCTNTLVSLSPCLDFITGNATKPTKSCCTQLGNVVSSQPQCLCQVIGGGGGSNSLGININQTQALALPAQCNVQTPPASRCSNAASPSGSPNAPTGTGGGSGTSTDGTSSEGNTAKLTLTLLFVGIFLASYSSVFPATAAV